MVMGWWWNGLSGHVWVPSQKGGGAPLAVVACEEGVGTAPLAVVAYVGQCHSNTHKSMPFTTENT